MRTLRTCSIGGCNKKHEAKGYCKVHYRSFSKYGDALYVEQKRAEQEKNRTEKEKYKAITRQLMSTEGVCKVNDCDSSIYAKRLCLKHYGRHLRKGSLEAEKKRNEIDTEECLVIGCSNLHARHGFCSTHIAYVRENETPYRPKIIKLCGVKGCENEHMGIGLCNTHYHQWRAIKRDYQLHKYIELK